MNASSRDGIDQCAPLLETVKVAPWDSSPLGTQWTKTPMDHFVVSLWGFPWSCWRGDQNHKSSELCVLVSFVPSRLGSSTWGPSKLSRELQGADFSPQNISNLCWNSRGEALLPLVVPTQGPVHIDQQGRCSRCVWLDCCHIFSIGSSSAIYRSLTSAGDHIRCSQFIPWTSIK